MVSFMKTLWKALYQDREFIHIMEMVEGLVSRILSVAMVAVILVACVDLVFLLSGQLTDSPDGFFTKELQDIFGRFLSILIALEILENITAYLRKHVVQVELVVATSLTAVARKIILLDLKKVDGTEIIGLALAIAALSLSYWLIRESNGGKGSTGFFKRKP
ncbi:MAG: phosphate-starvation-inducible PsiE family protein [Cyanophyceae cyanobacterium]